MGIPRVITFATAVINLLTKSMPTPRFGVSSLCEETLNPKP